MEFALFALVLLGVALFHRHTLAIAAVGAAVIALYKVLWSPFKGGAGWLGLVQHLNHEWVVLANLLLLLLGFAVLAEHFERSELPAQLPRLLPSSWVGCLVLLGLVFLISGVLDNIAAALIGGAVARAVFKAKVHVGYLAAIVAASNAGGAGSVVGDTTTTMMWIAGVQPLEVLEAYIGATVALLVFGLPAALQQHAHQPLQQPALAAPRPDWARLGVVAFILVLAVVVNVVVNTRFQAWSDAFPFLGAAVWVAILLASWVRKPGWQVLPGAFKGAVFLLSLVLCASMMPVEHLPKASWHSALALGFTSAVFDNIPLTALALKQGGYDWGFLAYAVGFGGSMLWFGSSAGVALASQFPQAQSALSWLRHGWHVVLAYVVGFLFMLLAIGFHPGSVLKGSVASAPPPAVHGSAPHLFALPSK